MIEYFLVWAEYFAVFTFYPSWQSEQSQIRDNLSMEMFVGSSWRLWLSLRAPCSAVKPLPKICSSQSREQSGNRSRRTTVGSNTNVQHQTCRVGDVETRRSIQDPDVCLSSCRTSTLLLQRPQTSASTSPPSEKQLPTRRYRNQALTHPIIQIPSDSKWNSQRR